MKRCLILGASTLAGSALLKRLISLGYHVLVILDFKENIWRITDEVLLYEHVRVNLQRPQDVIQVMRDFRPDSIFYMYDYGSEPYQNDLEQIQYLNVRLLERVCAELCNMQFQSFISLGSILEYGLEERNVPDNYSLKPDTHYGVAKACASQIVVSMNQIVDKKKFYIIRPGYMLGNFLPPNSDIANMILTYLRNGTAEVFPYSGYRNFVDVNTVVSWMVYLCQKRPAVRDYVFNILGPKAYNWYEFVEQIKHDFNFPVQICFDYYSQMNIEPIVYGNPTIDQSSLTQVDLNTLKELDCKARSIDLKSTLSGMINWSNNNLYLYSQPESVEENKECFRTYNNFC